MTIVAAVLIALCAAVAAALCRFAAATTRTTDRCHAMLRAATPLEVARIDTDALFDELHRAYWLGRAPRLTGLHAALYARTAPEVEV